MSVGQRRAFTPIGYKETEEWRVQGCADGIWIDCTNWTGDRMAAQAALAQYRAVTNSVVYRLACKSTAETITAVI